MVQIQEQILQFCSRFLCHIYGDLCGSNCDVGYLLLETMNNVNNKKDEIIFEF